MLRSLFTLKPSTWTMILGLFVLVAYALVPEIASAQGIGEAVNSSVKGFLYVMVLQLTGWFLWVGGTLLDYGVNTFVLNFGTIYNNGGVGAAIDELWVLVRDLFNILFIFGLVYIGFKMILNSDDSQTKKTLVSLIIAALLINFSLFITKFVVDFTNILASEIALAGFTGPDPFDDSPAPQATGERRVEVGNTFFRLMGITSFIDSTPEINNGTTAPWSFIFGIGIINIIGAFAFGVGGIMLVIRFIALSVYMVLSPFMFLGWIFPGFQGMSSRYWWGFFKQAFYAPVYIVMIFFSASILDNFFGAGGSARGGGIGNITQNNNVFTAQGGNVSEIAANFAGGLGPFILSAGFLIAAVQVAGKLSSDGSGVMAKVTNGVNSRVRGAVRGGARFGARNTVGYGAMGAGAVANGAANSRTYRKLNTALGNKWYTRGVASGMDSALSKAGKASVAGSRTAAEQKNYVRDRQNQINKQRDITGREDAILAYQKTDNAENKGKAAGAIAKLSDEELRNLSPKQLNDDRIISLMSEAQLKTLAETGDSTQEQIKDLKDRRQEAIFAPLLAGINDTEKSVEELGAAMDELAKTVKNLSAEQLQAMSKDRLNSEPIASNLSDKQLDAMRDSGKTPPSQLDDIKKTRTEGLTSIASTGGTKGQAIPTGSEGEEFAQKRRKKLVSGSVQDAGKLPVEVFKKAEMYEFITPAMLSQRIRNGDVDDSSRDEIEKVIKSYIAGASGKQKEKTVALWKKWQNGNDINSAGFKIV